MGIGWKISGLAFMCLAQACGSSNDSGGISDAGSIDGKAPHGGDASGSGGEAANGGDSSGGDSSGGASSADGGGPTIVIGATQGLGECGSEPAPPPGKGSVCAAGTRSSLFPCDWTPPTAGTVNPFTDTFLQDYSYAGYHHGEEEAPTGCFGTVYEVDAPKDGTGNAAPAIQAQIDAAQAAGGGIVFIPAGEYRCEDELQITDSNIVLRGDGSGSTFLWFPTESTRKSITVTRTMNSAALGRIESDGYKLVADAPVFQDFVEVSNASDIAAGDDILIVWTITQAFIDEHNAYIKGDTTHNSWSKDKANDFFRRTVTQVVDNRVYFKAPLRYPVKTRDLAHVTKVSPQTSYKNAYLTEVGIEHLAINDALPTREEAFNFSSSDTPLTAAVFMKDCKDCWIRDIATYQRGDNEFHIRSNGISLQQSFRVTITDVVLQNPQHIGSGNNGYLFELVMCNEALVRRGIARNGRHNLVPNWGFGNIGNVFLYCESTGGMGVNDYGALFSDKGRYQGHSETHGPLAIATLHDNVLLNDTLVSGNRHGLSGAGQTAAQTVYWNIRAGNVTDDLHPFPELFAFSTGYGYVIGTDPKIHVYSTGESSGDKNRDKWITDYAMGTEPFDFTELLGESGTISPVSIYEEQLARRLSK